MAARKQQKTLRRKIVVPKDCYFCVEKKEPYFNDVVVIQRFTTDRGKIIGRTRSGICTKHQKDLSDSIKYARHLAIMPFILRD